MSAGGTRSASGTAGISLLPGCVLTAQGFEDRDSAQPELRARLLPLFPPLQEKGGPGACAGQEGSSSQLVATQWLLWAGIVLLTWMSHS